MTAENKRGVKTPPLNKCDMMDAEPEGLSGKLRQLDKESNLENVYERSTNKKRVFIVVSIILMAILFVVSLCFGSVEMPIDETIKILLHAIYPGFEGSDNATHTTIVLKSYLPKTTIVVITGMSLGVAGAVMQGILRNPLVSPFTLGVSSAASFGAVVAIVIWPTLFGTMSVIYIFGNIFYLQNILVVILAFVFGVGSILFVLLLAKRTSVSKSTVILAGVIISYLFQAGVAFGKYISDDEALREVTNWLLGSVNGVTISTVIIIFPLFLICFLAIEYLAPKINLMAAGDDVAKSLGLNVKKTRNIGLLLATIITCICIAFTGVIGFIGLMAPHITRMIIGNDSRYLFPASAIVGAITLLISYILSTTTMRPSVLPLGIYMYVFGGIFFIWLIARKKKEVSL